MKDNIPANDPTVTDDNALGQNLQLLILHKTFNELTEGETEEEKGEKKK